ncbi:BSD2 [Scenedesmus sp. PABB004]|nr:BSD2 [Scenedesmus sp. PABB004]
MQSAAPRQRCGCGVRQQAAAAGGAGAGAAARRRGAPCGALDPVMLLAATDPAALQDVIVGGAVTAAVGAALVSGLRKEPQPCELCAGNGGTRCFACSGGGSMDGGDPDAVLGGEAAVAARPRRDPIGRAGGNPRACRVCKGTGLVLCRQCRGSGYVSRF